MQGKKELIEITKEDAEHIASMYLNEIEDNYLSVMSLDENPSSEAIKTAWKKLIDEEHDEFYHHGWEAFCDTYDDLLPNNIEIDQDAFDEIRSEIHSIYQSAFFEKTLNGILEHFGH